MNKKKMMVLLTGTIFFTFQMTLANAYSFSQLKNQALADRYGDSNTPDDVKMDNAHYNHDHVEEAKLLLKSKSFANARENGTQLLSY